MTRRRFTEREVLTTLIHQGVQIPCFRCGQPLTLSAASEHCVYDAEREHIHEVALDGPDKPENCRYSGKQCHGIATRGNGATTAGSSVNRIAKTRGTRAEKFEVRKKPLDEPREKKRWGFGRRA